MDLSDLQSTNSTETMPSDITENSSMITPSKRDIFLSTYNRRQKFTLPDSIMHYIAKNPKNTEFYEKMIKSCKYFFIKNPILVIDKLYYEHNGWGTWIKDGWKIIDINKLLCKLWITDQLYVFPKNHIKNSAASSITPKIYQCDVKFLLLQDQIISLNEFMFLCSSVKILRLYRVTVKNDDGTVLAFEKLIEQLPQLNDIRYRFTNPSNNISKNTFKELWKNPHLSNYDHFYLENIPEDFDIDSFYSFMKKNKKTRVDLEFSDEISEEYKARLEAIVDEIIDTENHGYKPPYIGFPGLDEEKLFKLHIIFYG